MPSAWTTFRNPRTICTPPSLTPETLEGPRPRVVSSVGSQREVDVRGVGVLATVLTPRPAGAGGSEPSLPDDVGEAPAAVVAHLVAEALCQAGRI